MSMRNLRLAAALVMITGAAAWAGDLAPASFVQADIEAREQTLLGMEQRLALLVAGADPQAEMVATEVTQAAVEAIFARYGTTPGGHAAYAANHQRDIDAWLQDNPDWQGRYADVEARLQELAASIDAARAR